MRLAQYVVVIATVSTHTLLIHKLFAGAAIGIVPTLRSTIFTFPDTGPITRPRISARPSGMILPIKRSLAI